MLDINFIRDNSEVVKKTVKDKGLELDIDKLLKIDKEKQELQRAAEILRKQRNEIAEKVKKGEKTDELIKQGKETKKELTKLDEKLRRTKAELDTLMLQTPQIPSEDTPIGKDESENVEVRKEGKVPKFNFKPKDHIELAKELDLIDFERGVKVSGYRGYFLKNEAVLIHMGLMHLGLKRMIKEGFTPMIPPTLNKAFTMFGTGWFPFDMDNIYKVAPAGKMEQDEKEEDGEYLVGTAEPPLCGYYAGEILDEEQLPIKLCGFSQCYRSEIGSHGKDTKGIYRIHEFAKVEQVIICKNDYKESDKWHQKLIGISESILKDLELPYRLIQMCTGDMGAGKYKMFDIETYMPSRKGYGETHSASNLGDWQARRLKVKYKTKKGEKLYVHMLNNTAIASPRILISLLELNQQKDGSVRVPKVLQEYVGKGVIRRKD